MVPAAGVDVAKLHAALDERVDSEVRFDPGTLGAYAQDASNYRQVPIGVVVPRTVDAGAEAVAVCREAGAPVLSRGGGTSLDGQCVNTAGRRTAIAQVHCHQHAIMGFDADTELLKACGVEVDVLDSGCCGLAGNFGFEAGHYEVSAACAEHGLWPAVQDARPETAVLADGFSCRTQIQAGHLGRAGVHLAQLLAELLETPA